MKNQTILALIENHTVVTEVTLDNIVFLLEVLGWNFKIYANNTIYLKKQKIELSSEDLQFMRDGIPSYNKDLKKWSQVEF